MADKYWWPSGGTGSSTGNWNSTTNWSSSSSSYVSTTYPTSVDNANFGSYSGASAFTVTYPTAFTSSCLNLSINNANMTWAGGGGGATLQIFGGITVTAFASRTFTGTLSFYSTTSVTVSFGSMTLASPLLFAGSGGTWTLGSALSTTGNIQLISGTLDTSASGNYSLTCTGISLQAGTKALKLNASTVTLTGTSPISFATNATGFTFTCGTSTISCTSASTKTFAGNGNTFYNVNQGGAGTLTISGSNTFNNITNSTQPATVTFTAGTTQTVSNFGLTGTSGNLITINSSSAGSAATLSKASGTVSVDYLSIKDSTATGGATWYAGANSTDVSGNTGWTFTAPPSSSNSNFLMFFC